MELHEQSDSHRAIGTRIPIIDYADSSKANRSRPGPIPLVVSVIQENSVVGLSAMFWNTKAVPTLAVCSTSQQDIAKELE